MKKLFCTILLINYCFLDLLQAQDPKIQLLVKDSVSKITFIKGYDNWQTVLLDSSLKTNDFDVQLKQRNGKYQYPNLKGLIIRSLSISPIHDNIAYAGIKGNNPGDGKIAMSMDYGKNWTYLNKGLPLSELAMDVQTIEQSPHHNKVIYAGTWKNGLYVSRDNGLGFRPVENFPSKDIRSILYHLEDRNLIVIATSTHGVVKSINGGKDWIIPNPTTSEETPLAIWKLEQSPYNKAELYALTFNQGLHRSLDFGNTWTKVMEHNSRMVFALGWKDENTIYCSSTNGNEHFLSVSTDKGQIFKAIENKSKDLFYCFLHWEDQFFLGGQNAFYILKATEIIESEIIPPFSTISHLKKNPMGMIIATWGNGLLLVE